MLCYSCANWCNHVKQTQSSSYYETHLHLITWGHPPRLNTIITNGSLQHPPYNWSQSRLLIIMFLFSITAVSCLKTT